jgi:large subunit ribosomal protein L10e
MGLRKAGSYSKHHARPYTRKSAVRSKAFVKTVPAPKIVKFNMGDQKGFNEGKYKIILRLITPVNIQIRDNALEAVRQLLLKQLDTKLTGQFYTMIKAHPHHILRENRVLTGAGADRMQAGMALSFGTALARAAMLKAGQDIIVLYVANEKGERIGRQILHSLRSKLPCPMKIVSG